MIQKLQGQVGARWPSRRGITSKRVSLEGAFRLLEQS